MKATLTRLIYLAGHSGLELSTPFLSSYSLSEKSGHPKNIVSHYSKINSGEWDKWNERLIKRAVSFLPEQIPH